jgi:mannosyltransferase
MSAQIEKAWSPAPLTDPNKPRPELRSVPQPAISIIVPNLHRRYSGITTMVRAFLRHGDGRNEMQLVGHPVCPEFRPRSLASLVFGFADPRRKELRVWHARRNNELVVGVVLKRLFRLPLKVVFTSASGRKKSATTLWLLRQADAIIATSPEAASATGRSGHIIPHGVDTAVYRPVVDRERAWASRDIGGRFGIGVFGRIRPQKGTDLFVEAMLRLLPRHPQFNAVIIGLAQGPHVAFRDALAARIERAGLADRIRFVGEAPADDVPAWLSSVSICVAPQRNEGFGLVPLEAAASGTAVVAARAGAAASVVKDGTTGFLVPPGDVDALTDAIDNLMASESLRRAMGQSAREHALDALGVDREVEANLRVFRSVVG